MLRLPSHQAATRHRSRAGRHRSRRATTQRGPRCLAAWRCARSTPHLTPAPASHRGWQTRDQRRPAPALPNGTIRSAGSGARARRPSQPWFQSLRPYPKTFPAPHPGTSRSIAFHRRLQKSFVPCRPPPGRKRTLWPAPRPPSIDRGSCPDFHRPECDQAHCRACRAPTLATCPMPGAVLCGQLDRRNRARRAAPLLSDSFASRHLPAGAAPSSP